MNDHDFIKELEKIDENYMEMSENDILDILDRLLEKASRYKITEWKAFIMSEKSHYQGKYSDSLRYTLEAIAMSPHNYYFLSSLATTYYFMEDYPKALTYYSKAIKENTQCYRAYIDRASVYRKTKEFPSAIKDAKYVIEHAHDPKMIATAKHSLARSYILSRDLTKAQELLFSLKTELSNSSEYYEALASLYEMLEDYPIALNYYKKAKELCQDPMLLTILNGKIKIYEKHECLDPVHDMLTELNIVSEEDSRLFKILYEHSDQQIIMKETYKKNYTLSKRKRPAWMKENYLLCLKGWSSSTPEFSLGKNISDKLFKGGGLYIRWQNKGIVIDPGINFMENFHNYELYAQDINYVIVTHNHIDHNCDLNTIIDLDYQLGLKLHYYLDESTYIECVRLSENPQFKKRIHCISFPTSKDIYEKEIYKNKADLLAFKTKHNCTGSYGIKLTLKGEKSIVISYTSDTAFFPQLVNHLENSNIIIANFSETNKDDLFLREYKTEHLGLKGCHSILKELKHKPNIFFLSEFWGGMGDIRIEISKRLKSLQKKSITVIPSDIGMICKIPDLKIYCSSCKCHYIPNNMHILKPTLSTSSSSLQYICNTCLEVLTNKND